MRCHWSFDPWWVKISGHSQQLRPCGSASHFVNNRHSIVKTQGTACIRGFGQTDGRRKFELEIPKSRGVSYIRGASHIREKTVISIWKYKQKDYLQTSNIISYHLFADPDTGIYPHAASQYHVQPNAKRGIAMLSVDKFPYPRKQTRCNEYIPCSNDVCQILKCFRSFKNSDTPFIWPKSSYKQSCSIASQRQRKLTAVVIAIIVTSSMSFLSHYISRWWSQTWDTCIYFTVVSQSEARVSTDHGIKVTP